MVALRVDRHGNVWIGSLGGLGVRRAIGGVFERIVLASDSGRGLVGEQVQALIERERAAW